MRAIIIGAGASGMAAALTAARRGHTVTLLERQARAGRKLMATGNGRCNLTNTNASPEHYHGTDVSFMRRAMEALPPQEALEFFRGIGLLTVEESGGRVYPLSNSANSVVDVLRFALEAAGVQLIAGDRAREIYNRDEGGFTVVTESGARHRADAVVVACGGLAGEKLCGGRDGYELLKSLGHTRTALRPALVQNISRRQGLDVVVNDPCLRHCSVRRDHMNLLAARRARPCDMLLAEQVKRLCDRAGCLASSAGAPLPVGECRYNFLTREDSRRLYDDGIRCFHVQAQPYRNELTLLWDFLHCLFDERPEYSHYRAAITASVRSAIHRHRATLPSGLGHFSSSLPE